MNNYSSDQRRVLELSTSAVAVALLCGARQSACDRSCAANVALAAINTSNEEGA
jgi:hypothetical protein